MAVPAGLTGAHGVPDSGGAEVHHRQDNVVMRMWGEHDISTAGLLGTALVEAIGIEDLDVVVDLREVTFMDCSTIGSLVHGRNLLAGRDRHLTVCSASSFQRRLFELCGLAEMIIETAPTENASPGRAASTAMESWVEVPPTPRLDRSSPAEREPALDDPERSRP